MDSQYIPGQVVMGKKMRDDEVEAIVNKIVNF
jgi:hypothetical protein